MDFFSHFLIGILTSLLTLNSMSFSVILYAGIMAVLADFDIFLAPLRLIRKSNLLSHKGISHSYFIAIIISLITGAIFSSITGESFLAAWIIGFLFYSIHITLDFLAASKIPVLYPFSKKRFRFFIDRAINLFLALISGSIILFYLIILFYWPELYFSNLYYYIFAFYMIYFSYRIISKIWVQIKLPKDCFYIPGILPFVYFIYKNHESENSLSFSLIKKVQFSNKNNLIIESQINKFSGDIELYKKSKEIANKYTFFSKWEVVIPIIEKKKNFYIVYLALGESYFSGSAYSLKVIFNKKLQKIENVAEGFNLIKIKNVFLNHNKKISESL